MSGDLRDIIEEALFGVLDGGDTVGEVNVIFDNIAKELKRDRRFPRLSALEIDLLFADARRDAETALESYSQVDWSDVADAVIAAIVSSDTTKDKP